VQDFGRKGKELLVIKQHIMTQSSMLYGCQETKNGSGCHQGSNLHLALSPASNRETLVIIHDTLQLNSSRMKDRGLGKLQQKLLEGNVSSGYVLAHTLDHQVICRASLLHHT